MSKKYILRGDPILSLAINKLRITTVWRSILFTLITVIISLLLIPLATGTFGLILKDMPSIILALFILPAIAIFYFNIQISMYEELEKGICATSVLPIGDEVKKQAWNKTRTFISSNILFILALSTTIVGLIAHIVDVRKSNPFELYWYYNPQHPYYFWGLRVPITGMFMYMGIMFAFRSLYLLFSVYRLFKVVPSVNIQVLHPDRCGGLAFLGNFSLKITYFIGLIGILIGTLFTASEYIYNLNPLVVPSYLLLFIAYLIGANAFFFLPLWSVHDRMKQSKMETLRNISIAADHLFDKLQEQITDKEIGSTEDFHKLYDLQKMYDIALSFPAWPFDIETLKRFGAVFVSPFFTPILYAIVEWFVKQFGHQNLILK